MKNLKTAIFALLCALMGVSSYGMNTPSDANTKPYTTCRLGESYSDDHMGLYEYKRDIITDDKIIGYIQYSDSRNDNGLERFIENFTIHAHLRGCGIGTLCMKLFLNDAKKDQVNVVSLSSMPRAESLYTRLGFRRPAYYSPYMQKKIFNK